MPVLIIGMEYVLDKEDQDLAIHIAKIRVSAAKTHGHTFRPFNDDTPMEVNVEGAAGEIAFCRLVGMEPDTSTPEANRSSMQGRDKKDLIYHGNRIDIKTTWAYHLCDKPVPVEYLPDYYVMIRGYWPQYQFMGAISGLDFKKKCHRMKQFRNEMYGVGMEELSAEILCKAGCVHA